MSAFDIDGLFAGRDPVIAQTIFSQLGGSRFTVMTGAKNFLDHGRALSFRLPGGPGFVKGGINYVKITLTWDDLYLVEFGRVWGKNFKTVHSVDGIFFDQLQPLFAQITGLDTHL